MKLVVLKSAISANIGNTNFKAHRFYRHVNLNNGYHIVNGEPIHENDFKALFMDAIERVKSDWRMIGILGENNEPISKSLFTKLADIHQYGNGKNNTKIWFFRNTRDCIYGFYPMQGNKVENQNECYQYYIDILNGDYEPLDDEDVCFGNCGAPLRYEKLRIQ